MCMAAKLGKVVTNQEALSPIYVTLQLRVLTRSSDNQKQYISANVRSVDTKLRNTVT